MLVDANPPDKSGSETLACRLHQVAPSQSDSKMPKDNSKTTKISPRVQQQLKNLNKWYSIQLEEIDFTNKRHLGRGAFCEIHEVSMNRQTFAMKRVSSRAVARSTPKEIAAATTDLAREAALLATTKHENIVQMHGISTGTLLDNGPIVSDDDEKCFFILVDQLEITLGRKITEWQEEQKMAQPPAWRVRKKCHKRLDQLMDRLQVALGIAKGLKYLHDKQIVHCDIKPENVGFDKDGVVKLFDFGLAMKLKDGKDTIQGTAGTRVYMAPEIHLKKPYGTKVDVYAFAITLWQLCALQSKPIFEPSLEDFSSFLIDGVRSLEDRPAIQNWWPTELRRLLEMCWRTEPKERPSCNVIVATITRILEERC